jgi:hypothetical protein
MRTIRTRESKRLRLLRPYLLICLLMPVLVCGCISHRAAMSHERHYDLLPFIETNRTTRDDLVKMMGNPSREFVEGKVWIYFLGLKSPLDGNDAKIVVCRDSEQQYETEKLIETSTERKCPLYHLVVSFNDENIVKRQTVVQIK